MQEVFDKIIEELEEYRDENLVEHDSEMANHCKQDCNDINDCTLCVWDKAIEIVKQTAAEYNNGWIPCSERLPEESGEYLTWVEHERDKFIAIDEIDCDGIIKEWNCSTNYKVIAWQPLPEQYNPKGE